MTDIESSGGLETGQLTVESIIAGGDGIARRPDGCVVFVPRSAPGDRVEVRFTEVHKQWRRAHIVRVLEGGPDRIEPPCAHYHACGGCHLQHLTYRAQLTAKTGIIHDALRRIGKIEPPEFEIVPSVREFEYRNRVTFILRAGAEGITAGYHALDDPGRVIDVDRCPLAEAAVNRVWTQLRDLWRSGHDRLPAGPELRLTLRAASGGGVGLAIEGVREQGDLEAVLSSSEALEAVWQTGPRGSIVARAGSKTLDDVWGPYRIRLAGTAFMQVNRGTAELLYDWVREQCGSVAGERIVDAYCGFGVNALELAHRGARVTGIDLDGRAVREASRIASGLGVPARFRIAQVERALKKALPAAIVILNPPRRGVARPVIDTLLERPPARIIYVSCNPATLARDINGLGARYRLVSCRAFDLFPQTAHVETVAVLERQSQ